MPIFDQIYSIHKLQYHDRICDLNILNRHSVMLLLHQLATVYMEQVMFHISMWS